MGVPTGWVEQGILFLGLGIILSVWAGYLGPAGIIPWGVALVLTFFLRQKGFFQTDPVHGENPSPWIIGIYLITLIYVFGVAQGGFDLSADVAPAFAAERIQGGAIPSTYLPYFDLPFFYPPGMPVLVSLLQGTGIPAYVFTWALGVLGILLLLFYTLRIAHELGIKGGQWLLPVLILGLRFPLQSLLYGEYSLLLGFGLGVAGIALGMKRWEWLVLGIGTAALLHPYAGIVTFIAAMLLVRGTMRERVTWGIGMGLLALPMILFQLLPLVSQSGKTTLVPMLPPIPDLFAHFSLVGIVPVAFLILLLAKYIRARPKLALLEHRPAHLVSVGIVLVLAGLFVPSLVFGAKAILLVGMGTVLYATLLTEKMGLLKHEKKIAGVLAVLLILSVLSSGLIHALVAGSKSTLEEATFAQKFGMQYPVSETRVLYLSHGHAKMAEYAHTIPFDALTAHFLTSVTYSVFHTPETMRIQDEAAWFKRVMQERCVTCVREVKSSYVVVNTDEFPLLPETPLAQDGKFVIYAGTP